MIKKYYKVYPKISYNFTKTFPLKRIIKFKRSKWIRLNKFLKKRHKRFVRFYNYKLSKVKSFSRRYKRTKSLLFQILNFCNLKYKSIDVKNQNIKKFDHSLISNVLLKNILVTRLCLKRKKSVIFYSKRRGQIISKISDLKKRLKVVSKNDCGVKSLIKAFNTKLRKKIYSFKKLKDKIILSNIIVNKFITNLAFDAFKDFFFSFLRSSIEKKNFSREQIKDLFKAFYLKYFKDFKITYLKNFLAKYEKKNGKNFFLEREKRDLLSLRKLRLLRKTRGKRRVKKKLKKKITFKNRLCLINHYYWNRKIELSFLSLLKNKLLIKKLTNNEFVLEKRLLRSIFLKKENLKCYLSSFYKVKSKYLRKYYKKRRKFKRNLKRKIRKLRRIRKFWSAIYGFKLKKRKTLISRRKLSKLFNGKIKIRKWLLRKRIKRFKRGAKNKRDKGFKKKKYKKSKFAWWKKKRRWKRRRWYNITNFTKKGSRRGRRFFTKGYQTKMLYRFSLTLKKSVFKFHDNSLSLKFYKNQKNLTKQPLNKLLVKPLLNLEVFIWKLSFFSSVRAVRQEIKKGNILVNGIAVRYSIILKKGDIVKILSINNLDSSKFIRRNFYANFCEVDFYTRTFILLRDSKSFYQKDLSFAIREQFKTQRFLYYLRKS